MKRKTVLLLFLVMLFTMLAVNAQAREVIPLSPDKFMERSYRDMEYEDIPFLATQEQIDSRTLKLTFDRDIRPYLDKNSFDFSLSIWDVDRGDFFDLSFTEDDFNPEDGCSVLLSLPYKVKYPEELSPSYMTYDIKSKNTPENTDYKWAVELNLDEAKEGNAGAGWSFSRTSACMITLLETDEKGTFEIQYGDPSSLLEDMYIGDKLYINMVDAELANGDYATFSFYNDPDSMMVRGYVYYAICEEQNAVYDIRYSPDGSIISADCFVYAQGIPEWPYLHKGAIGETFMCDWEMLIGEDADVGYSWENGVWVRYGHSQSADIGHIELPNLSEMEAPYVAEEYASPEELPTPDPTATPEVTATPTPMDTPEPAATPEPSTATPIYDESIGKLTIPDDPTFAGFANFEGGLFYFTDGQQRTDYVGPVQIDGTFYAFDRGRLQTENMMMAFEGGLFAFNGGKLRTDLTGLAAYDGEQFVFDHGQYQHQACGPYLDPISGKWVYVNYGQYYPITDLVTYDGEVFYFVNGELASGFTGIVRDFNGTGLYIGNGQHYKITDLINNNGQICYVVDGVFAEGFTGVVTDFAGTQFNIVNGVAQ